MNRSRCSELIEGWVSSPYVTSLLHSTVQEAREEGGAADEVDDDAMAIFKLITTLSEYFISTYLFDPAPSLPNSPPSLDHPDDFSWEFTRFELCDQRIVEWILVGFARVWSGSRVYTEWSQGGWGTGNEGVGSLQRSVQGFVGGIENESGST